MKKYLSLLFVIVVALLTYFSYEKEYSNQVINFTKRHNTVYSDVLKMDDGLVDDFIREFDVNVLSKTVLEDRVIIEGYTKKIKSYFVLNNLKVNIQISIFNGEAIVGSPLIDNSF